MLLMIQMTGCWQQARQAILLNLPELAPTHEEDDDDALPISQIINKNNTRPEYSTLES